jgi:putative intracellular protease/amidase
MNSSKRWNGRRIAALAADGFEKVELTVPRRALRRASSAPQRDEPSSLVLNTMKWMPRPWFRTAKICGALGLGRAAGNQRRLAA